MLYLPTLIAQFGNSGFESASTQFLIDTSSVGAANCSALSTLELTISRIIGVITMISALFFIVYFFLAAFQWITAGGDSGAINKARDKMTQGVIGLIIIIASYSVIGLVGTVIGLDILNPLNQFESIFGQCNQVPVNPEARDRLNDQLRGRNGVPDPDQSGTPDPNLVPPPLPEPGEAG
jgi:hypothetical protein